MFDAGWKRCRVQVRVDTVAEARNKLVRCADVKVRDAVWRLVGSPVAESGVIRVGELASNQAWEEIYAD